MRLSGGAVPMKRLLPLLVIFAAAYFYQALNGSHDGSLSREAPTAATGAPAYSPAATTALVDGRQAKGSGTVVRVLSDDNDGSRHQRFILRLAGGRTLLIAHNIDLAPRIPGIRKGDTVEFYGEFRSNPEGGVIHWTHHDPQGRHPGGWLRHKGRTYQ
jgi:hypothetical protein